MYGTSEFATAHTHFFYYTKRVLQHTKIGLIERNQAERNRVTRMLQVSRSQLVVLGREG